MSANSLLLNAFYTEVDSSKWSVFVALSLHYKDITKHSDEGEHDNRYGKRTLDRFEKIKQIYRPKFKLIEIRSLEKNVLLY